MSSDINKEDIIRLAKLARIDLQGQEDSILKDALRILKYFEELKGVNTDGVLAINNAIDMVNITDNDDINQELLQKGIKHFPEIAGGCLKVPGVMHNGQKNE